MKKALSLFLAATILTLSLLALSSCGVANACAYFSERDTEGRDIRYAKISYKDYGDVYLILDRTSAPITVDNFLKLANQGFYNNLTMHRVMENFMIQGGDPDGNGTGGSKDEIYGEFLENGYLHNDLSHIEGVISMARSNEPNSASSQFFICNADASASLDGKYAAFGYVISGLGIIHEITSDTVKYANSQSGTIADKSKHAVILTITEVTAEEALKAANG